MILLDGDRNKFDKDLMNGMRKVMRMQMIVTGQRGVSVQNSTSAFIIKYDQTKRIDLRVLYSTYLNNPSPKRYPLNINNSHPPPNIQLHLTLVIPTYVRRGEPTSTMS